MEKILEIILRALASMWSFTVDIKGSRDPYATISHEDMQIRIYKSWVVGRVTLGIKLKVSEYPEICLKQIQEDDDPQKGMIHRWQLSEDQTQLEYWYEGHNGYTTTGNWHKDNRVDPVKEVWVKVRIKPEELDILPNPVDCYHKDIKRTLKGLPQILEEVCELFN